MMKPLSVFSQEMNERCVSQTFAQRESAGEMVRGEKQCYRSGLRRMFRLPQYSSNLHI